MKASNVKKKKGNRKMILETVGIWQTGRLKIPAPKVEMTFQLEHELGIVIIFYLVLLREKEN